MRCITLYPLRPILYLLQFFLSITLTLTSLPQLPLAYLSLSLSLNPYIIFRPCFGSKTQPQVYIMFPICSQTCIFVFLQNFNFSARIRGKVSMISRCLWSCVLVFCGYAPFAQLSTGNYVNIFSKISVSIPFCTTAKFQPFCTD